MLALQVEYLMGKVYAGDFRDRSAPEWPPHPARLFSALTSACFETEAGGRAVDALLWLEKQGPPLIAAGQSGPATPYTCFVPTNYVDKNGMHTKQPRFFPSQTPEEPMVHFIWPAATPSNDLRNSIDDLASRVAYLGKSSSLVRIRVNEQPPPPTYVPSPRGEFVFRVPAEGRLAELRRMFEAGRWDPSTPAQQRYTRPAATVAAKVGAGFFGEVFFLRRIDGPPLPMEATLTVTQAFRNALMAVAGRDGDVPELLHGHSSSAHSAFIAIPFVGYSFADGRLLGCGLLIPRDCDPAARKAVLRALGKLNNITLTRELGRWTIEEVLDPDHAALSLRAETWTRPGRIWKSVTPVLLNKFPKQRVPVEQIVLESCEHAGLPQPISIQHGAYSDVPGVPPVPRFRLLRNMADRPRWGVHVTLTFAQPVRGPILIGAGRFFGLGLMRPADSRGEQL